MTAQEVGSLRIRSKVVVHKPDDQIILAIGTI